MPFDLFSFYLFNFQVKPIETVAVDAQQPIDNFDNMSNIIQVGASDSEPELTDHDPTVKQPAPSMRFIPAKRVEHIGPVQMRQVTNVKQVIANKVVQPSDTKQQSTTPATTSSAVIPLLTPNEICRQLLELRKQNEELRRKFELAQKEKEEMRQRLERLEELLLVERADEDFVES